MRYGPCISGFEDTENREIYETYMHFDQIAGNGIIKSNSKSSEFRITLSIKYKIL